MNAHEWRISHVCGKKRMNATRRGWLSYTLVVSHTTTTVHTAHKVHLCQVIRDIRSTGHRTFRDNFCSTTLWTLQPACTVVCVRFEEPGRKPHERITQMHKSCILNGGADELPFPFLYSQVQECNCTTGYRRWMDHGTKIYHCC